MAHGFFTIFFLWHWLAVFSRAASISTSITVPPLQWVNLSGLLSGSTSPPALKDASIGYDETSRSLIIFGGESESGLAQSSTYLLNLDTLLWSIPSPPSNLLDTPKARSAAIAGCDFAASNRHGFVVIGGKGADGTALSDAWEFDFTNQFWSELNIASDSPPARWGAIGGIDIRTDPIQDPVIAGPNNTFYLVGGTDGTQVFSLSDVWRFNISGALSSNLPDDASASWDRLSFDDLPSMTGAGGTVLRQQVISVGGCGSSTVNSSCPRQDAYVLDTSDNSKLSPTGCPVPRENPVMVSNPNTLSTSFANQAFLLLGTFNKSLWSDGGNLQKGEVAILDTNTGIWSRVLPSGDPGNSGIETFPSPRQGSAAFSYSQALVGSSRSSASDIVVFGGQDESGKYLSELWILRAYDGTVTSSSPQWSGYGDSDDALESGVDASGTHVSVQILSECASAIVPDTTSSTPDPTATSSSTPDSTSSGTGSLTTLYDTAFYHKIFAPLSLTIFLPAFVVFRLFSSTYTGLPRSEGTTRWIYLSGLLTLISYGMGVAALAISFTSITVESAIQKRSTRDTLLKTTHGKVSLVFFLGFYAVVPLLLLLMTCLRRRSSSLSVHGATRRNSTEMTEKQSTTDAGSQEPIVPDFRGASRSPSPRLRTPSFGTSGGLLRPSGDDRRSSDNESLRSGPQRGFEVVNRPNRHHKTSGSSNWFAAPIEPQHAQRTLAEIDWLQRRRSLNAVDQLDYAITRQIRAQQVSAHHNALNTSLPAFPSWLEVFSRCLLHLFLIGLCILCLVALWSHAPSPTFGVFLAWVVITYLIIIYLSWMGRPPLSTLSIIFLRLRTTKAVYPTLQATPAPASPYLHQPSHRAVPSSERHETGPEEDDDEDDEDEDARQQRIESEMERREVSIVTVPKRKLLIANPS